MKAKRWLIAILAIALVATMVCAVACDNHVHNYSEWGKSDTQHWKYCPDDNEEEAGSRANHVYGDNGKCVCGADDPNPAPTNVYTGILDKMEVTITLNDGGVAVVSGSSETYTYELDGTLLTLIYESGAREYLELNSTDYTFIQLDKLYKVVYTAANGKTLTFDGKGSALLDGHTGTYEIVIGEYDSESLKLTIGGETYEIDFDGYRAGGAIKVTITIDSVDYIFGAPASEWGDGDAISIDMVVGVWKNANGDMVYISTEYTGYNKGSIIIDGKFVNLTMFAGALSNTSGSVEIVLGANSTIKISGTTYEYVRALNAGSIDGFVGAWEEKESGVVMVIGSDESVMLSSGETDLILIDQFAVIDGGSYVLSRVNNQLVGYYTYYSDHVAVVFETTVIVEVNIEDIEGVWESEDGDEVIITLLFADGDVVGTMIYHGSDLVMLLKGLGSLEGSLSNYDNVTITYDAASNSITIVVSSYYDGDSSTTYTYKGAVPSGSSAEFEGAWIDPETDYCITIDGSNITHSSEDVTSIEFNVVGKYLLVHYQVLWYGDEYDNYYYLLTKTENDTLEGLWFGYGADEVTLERYKEPDPMPEGADGTYVNEDGTPDIAIYFNFTKIVLSGNVATIYEGNNAEVTVTFANGVNTAKDVWYSRGYYATYYVTLIVNSDDTITAIFNYGENYTYTFTKDDSSTNPGGGDQPSTGYTVSFNPAAQSGITGTTPADTSVAAGAEFELPQNPWSRPGYLFTGWKIKHMVEGNWEDTGTTNLQPGSKYTVNENIQVVAIWESATNTVIYHANGGSGTMANQTVKTPSRLTFAECTFTAPEGKKFKGWSASENGDLLGDSLMGSVTGYLANLVWVEETGWVFNVYAIWEDDETVTPPVEDNNITVANAEGVWTNGSSTIIISTAGAGTYNYEAYNGSIVMNGEFIRLSEQGTSLKGFNSLGDVVEITKTGTTITVTVTGMWGMGEQVSNITYSSKTDITNANISDFVGTWKRTGNAHQITIKDDSSIEAAINNAEEVEFYVVGQYAVVSYTTGGYLYGYVLSRAGDNLEGYFVADEKAPAAVTFEKIEGQQPGTGGGEEEDSNLSVYVGNSEIEYTKNSVTYKLVFKSITFDWTDDTQATVVFTIDGTEYSKVCSAANYLLKADAGTDWPSSATPVAKVWKIYPNEGPFLSTTAYMLGVTADKQTLVIALKAGEKGTLSLVKGGTGEGPGTGGGEEGDDDSLTFTGNASYTQGGTLFNGYKDTVYTILEITFEPKAETITAHIVYTVDGGDRQEIDATLQYNMKAINNGWYNGKTDLVTHYYEIDTNGKLPALQLAVHSDNTVAICYEDTIDDIETPYLSLQA